MQIIFNQKGTLPKTGLEKNICIIQRFGCLKCLFLVKLIVSLENREAEQARSTATIPGVIHLCHGEINKSISVNVPGF